MKGYCKECSEVFSVSMPEVERAHKLLLEKGITKIFTECPKCGDEVRVDTVIPETPQNYRCPVSGCSGWVDHIETGFPETPFWGCGECGSRWRKKESLFAEISEIVKKYKYRKKSYILQKDGTYLPSDLSAETPDYDEKVEKESMDDKFDDSDSFFRD